MTPFAGALTALFLVILMAGCPGHSGKPVSGIVTDIDGNRYGTVTIGNHLWMTENLNVTRYRNGDPIPEIQDGAAWSALDSGARSRYGNQPAHAQKRGMLYNWIAVNDKRGLAPAGWHIATDEEWRELVEASGGESSAAEILKASGEWEGEKSKNSNGFNALPMGARRDSDGQFVLLGQFARFWTATPASNGKAWGRAMEFYDNAVRRGEVGPRNGFSVRCIRD
jgi:uncharacterized protein (TIGR02145 family)